MNNSVGLHYFLQINVKINVLYISIHKSYIYQFLDFKGYPLKEIWDRIIWAGCINMASMIKYRM